MATLVNISIKGYTEAGHEASFDFTANGDDVQAEMIDAMNQLWLAGVTPNLPTWIQEHDFEICDTVILREQENRDGSRTPIVIMYPTKPHLERKFLHEYLDSAEDRATFERMIGRKLSDMPVYPGTNYPDIRGNKVKQSEAQYFVKVRPFGVLKRKPEAGDSDETREKHRLVRFIPISPVSQPTPPQPQQPATTPADVKAAANALNTPPTSDPTFDEMFPKGGSNPFNKNLPATLPPAQPTLMGDNAGKRSPDEIQGMCVNFYAWLKENHPTLTHDDVHMIFEVDSMKTYFATRTPMDAKRELTAYVKTAAELAKKAG